VTVLFVIACLRLILVNDQLALTALTDNLRLNCCALDIIAYLETLVIDCKDLIECYDGTCLSIKLLNADDISLGNLICFPPVTITAYMKCSPPSSDTRQIRRCMSILIASLCGTLR
jgi:hypothetical protein